MEEFIVPIFITLIVIIVLFLIFREVACWYWKINESIAQRGEIIKILRGIAQVNGVDLSKLNSIAPTGPSRTFLAGDYVYILGSSNIIDKLKDGKVIHVTEYNKTAKGTIKDITDPNFLGIELENGIKGFVSRAMLDDEKN